MMPIEYSTFTWIVFPLMDEEVPTNWALMQPICMATSTLVGVQEVAGSPWKV